MRKDSEKERKTSIIQAAILGRVERLAGSGFDSNPFSQDTDQWRAFVEGWSRSLDDPITRILQQGKKIAPKYTEPRRDRYDLGSVE